MGRTSNSVQSRYLAVRLPENSPYPTVLQALLRQLAKDHFDIDGQVCSFWLDLKSDSDKNDWTYRTFGVDLAGQGMKRIGTVITLRLILSNLADVDPRFMEMLEVTNEFIAEWVGDR